MLQRLTNQLNGVLFPVVVDSDAGQQAGAAAGDLHSGHAAVAGQRRAARRRRSCLLAGPLIRAWVGPKFDESIVVAQILIVVVAIRVGNATATTVLKGAGQHRLLAFTNAGTALGERRAEPAVDPPLRPDRSGDGHAGSGRVHVDRSSCGRRRAAASASAPVAAFSRRPCGRRLWPVAVMALVIDSATPGAAGAAVRGGTRRRHRGARAISATFLAFAVKKDERRTYIAKASELARSRRRVAAAA